MKTKVSLVFAAVIAVGMFAMSTAQSAPVSFSFDVDSSSGVFGPPGSTTVLATKDVDSPLIGQTCQATIDVSNNDSIRTGTDLLVTSGGATLEADNVEAAPGDAPPVVLGNLTLGSTIVGSVRFGPEGASSVSATIIVDCPDVSPTTLPPTTTTVAPTTTTGPTQVLGEVVSVGGVVVVQPTFTG